MTLEKSIQKFCQSARNREARDGHYRLRWGHEVKSAPGSGSGLIINQHTYRGIHLLRPICRASLTIARSGDGCAIEKEVCYPYGEGLNEACSVQFPLQPEDAAKRLLSKINENHSIARLCLDCTLGIGCDRKLYFGTCCNRPN